MILSDLQRRLRTGERASLAQLALTFETQPDALRGMLDHLVAKGRVRRVHAPKRCAGCSICPREALEFYEWATVPATEPAPTCAIDFVPAEERRSCPHCG